MVGYFKKIQSALNLMMKKYNSLTKSKSSSSDNADNGEADEEDFMSCNSSGPDSKDIKKAINLVENTQKSNSTISTSQNQKPEISQPNQQPAVQSDMPQNNIEQNLPNLNKNQLPLILPNPIGNNPNPYPTSPFPHNNFGVENLPPEIRKHIMQPTEFNDSQSIDFIHLRSESDNLLNTSNSQQVMVNKNSSSYISEGVGIQAQPNFSDDINVQVNAEARPSNMVKEVPKETKSIEIQVSPPRDN